MDVSFAFSPSRSEALTRRTPPSIRFSSEWDIVGWVELGIGIGAAGLSQASRRASNSAASDLWKSWSKPSIAQWKFVPPNPNEDTPARRGWLFGSAHDLGSFGT